MSLETLTQLITAATPLTDYGVAHASLGHAPPEGAKTFSLPNGIIEHYQRDFTVRVAAGTTLGDLNAQLADTNQFLPIDADDDVTIGEIINCNIYGPLRVGYGSIRDLMLGLHYLDHNGNDIHVGGRTVKNVAGYDLSRFMVGSLGQFGIVHEATLRTYAIPQQVTVATITIEDPPALGERMTSWMLSDAWPTWLSLTREDHQWRLRAGYYGRPAAHDVQTAALRDLFQGVQTSVCTLTEDLSARQNQRAWRRTADHLLKVVVLPAATGIAANLIAQRATRVEALPAHGCIFADLTKEDDALRDLIAEHGGFRVWHANPDRDVEPFAPPQNDWPILKKLKTAMDPDNIFNPGRFL